MIETLEVPVQEIAAVEQKTLEEILPAVKRLSAHNKLVLIRILAEELEQENREPQTDPLLELLAPNTVIEMYSPVEINGSPETLEALVKMVSSNES